MEGQALCVSTVFGPLAACMTGGLGVTTLFIYRQSGEELNASVVQYMQSVYEKSGMSSMGEGMSCGVVVVVVKHSTLRWFGHPERMGE